MNLEAGFISALQQIINDKKNKTDIDYTIAQYILNNLYSKDITANKISVECHTSIASVTRFAQNLSYSGFSDFKNDLDLLRVQKKEMQIDLNSFDNKNHSTTNSTEKLLDEFITSSKSFEDFITEIDLLLIEELADQINKADNIVIYSILIPGNLSLILQNMLLTAGKYVEHFPAIRDQYDSTKELSENDLTLFVSLEGTHTMNKELTLSVTESDATNVLITHNPEMKLGSLFDYIIPLGNHDIERSGKYKLLAFIEILSHFYFKKYS